MQSQIPVPTDNIYKFYALFGILLIVSSLLGVVYVSTNTNNSIHSLTNEYYFLDARDVEAKTALESLIERRLDVVVKNKRFYEYFLGSLLAMGIAISFYGFRQWHTQLQPKLDRILDLEIEKLENETNKSRSDTESSH